MAAVIVVGRRSSPGRCQHGAQLRLAAGWILTSKRAAAAAVRMVLVAAITAAAMGMILLMLAVMAAVVANSPLQLLD